MSNKNALSKYHFFSRINTEELPLTDRQIFANTDTINKYKKKEIIYEEGSNSRGAYLIVKGMVKVYQTNADGTEHIIFFFSEGEIFGFRPLLSDSLQPFTAKCLNNCEIKFINKDNFLSLIDTSPVFAKQLMVGLSHSFTVLVNRINYFAQNGIRQRLALALLLLNEKFKSPNSLSNISNINITRSDLACYVGSSIDVISRNLNYFIEKNYIRTKGKSIFIVDYNALINVSGIT